jgi:hypothetical protein
MRDKERKKKRDRRNKTEIRPFQLQTVITFDRKLRLRRATRLRKVYDEIYEINTFSHYGHFSDQKISS